jgi:cytochrome c2
MLDKFVKLTKSINRRVGQEEYYKYIITIPKKFVDQLKWTENTKLDMKVDGKKLVIERE